MRESTRILTTHVGSLPRPQEVVIDRHINTIRAANSPLSSCRVRCFVKQHNNNETATRRTGELRRPRRW